VVSLTLMISLIVTPHPILLPHYDAHLITARAFLKQDNAVTAEGPNAQTNVCRT